MKWVQVEKLLKKYDHDQLQQLALSLNVPATGSKTEIIKALKVGPRQYGGGLKTIVGMSKLISNLSKYKWVYTVVGALVKVLLGSKKGKKPWYLSILKPDENEEKYETKLEGDDEKVVDEAGYDLPKIIGSVDGVMKEIDRVHKFLKRTGVINSRK